MKEISDLMQQREQFAAKLRETEQQSREHTAALDAGDVEAASKAAECKRAAEELRAAIGRLDSSIAEIEQQKAAAERKRAISAAHDVIGQTELQMQYLRRQRDELVAELVAVLSEGFESWNELEIQLHKAEQKGLADIRAFVPDLTREIDTTREPQRHDVKMQQLAAITEAMTARGISFDAMRVPRTGAKGWIFKPQGDLAKAVNEIFSQQPRDFTGALIRGRANAPAAANLPRDPVRGRTPTQIENDVRPWPAGKGKENRVALPEHPTSDGNERTW